MNKLVEAITRVDTPSTQSDFDFQRIKIALERLRDQYVDERVKGMSLAGQPEQAPVSREEAEAKWQAAVGKFASVMLGSKDVTQRLGLRNTGQYPGKTDYTAENPAGQTGDEEWAEMGKGWEHGNLPRAERAAMDEPALRRGESLARKLITRMLT